MGRYYSGDIEGKFWFGIQSSNAADRFGVIGSEPNYITYYFTRDNLPQINAELKKIENTLGDYFQKIKDFFDSVDFYNDEQIAEALGFDNTRESTEKVRKMLSEYADHGLGMKIKEHVEKFNECVFDAEY